MGQQNKHFSQHTAQTFDGFLYDVNANAGITISEGIKRLNKLKCDEGFFLFYPKAEMKMSKFGKGEVIVIKIFFPFGQRFIGLCGKLVCFNSQCPIDWYSGETMGRIQYM